MGRGRLGYVPALDGVRAVAISLVIAGHIFGKPGGGALGVDIFFVLSGFLITSLLLDEHTARGSIWLRGFYARRSLRIFPAAWTYTIICVVLVAAANHGHIGQWLPGALAAAGYLGNIVEGFGVRSLPFPFGHFWSLAAEEQFYLVWPLLLAALLARRVRLARIAAGLAVAAAASSVLSIVYWQAEGSRTRIWFSPDTHLAPIAVGCLAAVVFNLQLVPSRLLSRSWPVAAAVCVVIVAVPPFDHRWLYDGPFVVFPFACALVVLAATERSLAQRLLSMRLLRWFGKLSYSAYLWHLLFAPAGAAGIPITVGAAWLSRRFVEQPFLRRKDRLHCATVREHDVEVQQVAAVQPMSA